MSRLAEGIFWLHAIIFVVWIGLFFVPVSFWPQRIHVHFWYVLIMVMSEIVMGLLLMKHMHKFRIVCPLTALMQYIRGYSLTDPKNYDHSFVREFAERFHLSLPKGFVGGLIFTSLGLIILEYIFWG
jgi:hypothetical protein